MARRRKKQPDRVLEPAPQRRTHWPDTAFAVGLAVIVFVRPWRDGASFQGFNAYFVWLTMGLAAFWSARLVLHETQFRFARLAAPLGVFLIVGALTAYDSYLPDATFRSLIYWTTSFFLFLLAANTLSTPLTRGVFYTAFVVSLTCSAAWALIHLEYVLPRVREAIEANPGARQYFFQTTELPAELAHRLSVNRAYGATLFPNALAALMILALPFLIGEFLAAMRDLRLSDESDTPQHPPQWRFAISIGAITAISLGVTARIAFPVLYVSVTNHADWRASGALALFALYVLPIALGTAIALLIALVGRARAWLYVQVAFLPLASILVATALLKTYSRGGMLALGLSAALITVLVILRFQQLRPRSGSVAAILLLAVTFLTVASHAQLPAQGIETDVLSPESFLARLDYWLVGLAMIRENPLTGVGLGAFGAAYGNYMFPGAATSQMAHNHFIQVFAETGIAGLLSISAFWAFFLIFMVRRLVSARDLSTVLRIAGPFCGVLAFLVHALVDFNFANPSLAMTAFIVAGACCARADVDHASVPMSASRSRAIAIPLLIMIAVVTGGMIRIFMIDFTLTGPMPIARKLMLAGNRLEIRDKLHSATYYLDRLATHAENPQRVLYSGYEELLRIIPDDNRIMEFGFFAQLDQSDGNRFHPIAAGDPIPPDAVIVITDVDGARIALIETADALLQDLESIDAPYPYMLEVSMHAYQWCDLVYKHAPDEETKREFALLGETWARRCVERSPHQSASWLAYAKALWQRAATETGRQSPQRYYDQGLSAYRKSAEAFPSAPSAWENYANALDKLGTGYVEGGLPDKGAPLLAEAEEMRNRARALRKVWAQARERR